MTTTEHRISGIFTPEQDELRATAQRFLAERSPSETVRALMETEEGFDEATWKQISGLGWTALAIPEEYGGLGTSLVEVAILLEEMGRRLFCAPYVSAVVLGTTAILNGATNQQKGQILPEIAEGSTRPTVAISEPGDRPGAAGINLLATPKDGDWVLDGTKTYVLDGCTATLLVVAARTGGSGAGGVSLFLVDPMADGVCRRSLETLDRTRKQAQIDFESAPAMLLGEEGAAWPGVERTLDQAVAVLASETLGGAQRCLDMSVEYAKERKQFGRAIGSFQAIKHRCADMLMRVEMSRSAAYYAAQCAAEADEELALVAPLAKAYCADAFAWVASETIQVHGGIGFTFEHDAHLYFRRAKTMEVLFGSSNAHRETLTTRLGL